MCKPSLTILSPVWFTYFDVLGCVIKNNKKPTYFGHFFVFTYLPRIQSFFSFAHFFSYILGPQNEEYRHKKVPHMGNHLTSWHVPVVTAVSKKSKKGQNYVLLISPYCPNCCCLLTLYIYIPYDILLQLGWEHFFTDFVPNPIKSISWNVCLSFVCALAVTSY